VIDWTKYLEASKCRPGAAPSAIAEVEKQLGLELPRDYSECLSFSNGYEGVIGRSDGNFVRIWRVEDLLATNEAYQPSPWAPGLLLFGTDGGGEGFGFDLRASRPPIVMIPFIPMNWSEARRMGDTFPEFLQLMFEGKVE
jgi:cell wall assembly regulator SMI1